MMKNGLKIIVQALCITMAAAALAITTNLVRKDGIPLIAEVEYDIFSQCVDSEAESQAASSSDIASAKVLYIDARPKEAFAVEHIDGAVNAPYSVLFGASLDEIERIQTLILERNAETVIVYGELEDSENPEQKVDLASPLAEQLIENKVPNVKHIDGGILQLKKNGAKTVKGGSKEQ